MNYKDRDIYQKAIKFSISIIDQTNKLPKSFSNMVISRQLIRSSTSIGANIAEGSAGVSRKEFINYDNNGDKKIANFLATGCNLRRNTPQANVSIATTTLKVDKPAP